MPRRVRDYKDEYAKYHSSPEQKKNRAQRNAARAKVVASRGATAVRGKDVDHKTAISKGGKNSSSNLRVVSKTANRSYSRTKTGKMK